MDPVKKSDIKECCNNNEKLYVVSLSNFIII